MNYTTLEEALKAREIIVEKRNQLQGELYREVSKDLHKVNYYIINKLNRKGCKWLYYFIAFASCFILTGIVKKLIKKYWEHEISFEEYIFIFLAFSMIWAIILFSYIVYLILGL